MPDNIGRITVPTVINSGNPPGDWPLRALGVMEARPSGKALLLRRRGQAARYPAAQEIEYEEDAPLATLLQLAAVLGEWYRNPHGRFQLGPAVRISRLLAQFSSERITAEFRLRTDIGDLTNWRCAVFIRVFDRAEVLTPKPVNGGSVQIRLLLDNRTLGETEFTTLDRRALDLSQVPSEPEERPEYLRMTGSTR